MTAKQAWRNNKWLIIVFVAAAIFSLTGLGARHFWGDEVHLLNLGKSIPLYGVPVVDNSLRQIEVTYEIDDLTRTVYNERVDYGIAIGDKVIYTLHPWLTSYIASIPIVIFGPYNEFFIRLPFVFIGLLAIPITYFLAKRISNRKQIAILSALLLAGSVVYLLALRNANYYGLILFAIPATLLCYLRTLNKEKNAWWQFALSGAMLFHSQWIAFIGTMLGICIHFLIFNHNLKSLKLVAKPVMVIFLLTFPWFLLTGQFNKSGVISTPMQYFLLFCISCYHFILWFVPLLFILYSAWLVVFKKQKKWLFNSGYALLALTIIASFLFASLNYYTGTPIRYYYGLLPLAMIFNAAIIEKFWQQLNKFSQSKPKKQQWVWQKAIPIALVVLLVCTNFIQIVPLLPFKPIISRIAGSQDVLGTGEEAQQGFVAKTLKPRIILGEYLYEITHKVQTPTRAVIDAILPVSPRGKNIFVAAGDANAIGYYTGLTPATNNNNYATRNYDWIVLPASDARNAQIDNNKYSKMHFSYATDRWGDTADPVHHLFRTTEGSGFYLYRRK
ncbi:MAG: glycosyltransferase family 39 protein [Candidatus Woesearchaeota archaeon]